MRARAHDALHRAAGLRFVLVLGAAFCAWFVLLAIEPRYPADWALESSLTVTAIVVLVVVKPF